MDFTDYKEAIVGLYPPRPTFTEKDYPDLTGKVFIVTGGTAGIGLKVADFLIGKNAKVYITGRGEEKLNKAVAILKEEHPDALVDYLTTDYNDLATIRPGIKKFLDQEKELHGIVHNAGVMSPPYGSYTKQGYELQFGVNNVAPHLVQKYLDPIILKTASNAPVDSVRLVWVSSSGHLASPKEGGIQWDDINFKNKDLGMVQYGQSKAINIYESIQWKKHNENSGILSLAVHPGAISTDLARHYNSVFQRVAKFLLHDVRYGAYSELYCLLNPNITAETQVNFYQPWGRPGKARNDVAEAAEGEAGDKLWKYLEEEVKHFYEPFGDSNVA